MTVKSLDTLNVFSGDARATACVQYGNCTIGWISDTYERQFEFFVSATALDIHWIQIKIFNTHVDAHVVAHVVDDINHLMEKRNEWKEKSFFFKQNSNGRSEPTKWTTVLHQLLLSFHGRCAYHYSTNCWQPFRHPHFSSDEKSVKSAIELVNFDFDSTKLD